MHRNVSCNAGLFPVFCVGEKDADDTDDLRLFLIAFMFRCALG